MITLYDIKNLLQYDCDLADDEYDTLFYADIVNTTITKEIEVVAIHPTHIVCKFSQFMRTHKDYLCNVIHDTYAEPYASQFSQTLANEDDEDTWCYLIERTLQDILEYESQGDK